MKYILIDKQALSPTTMQVTLQPEGDDRLEWQPGQYIAIDFKRFGRPTPSRCFSITNQPNKAGTIQLAMRVSGRFTSTLSNQPLYTSCNVQGPFGNFVTTPDMSSHSVLIAGGIGITPIYALATHIAQLPGHYCTVLYSIRDQQDAPYADELEKLADKHPNVRLAFVVTGGPVSRFSTERRLSGVINAALLQQASNHKVNTTSYYVCGPQGFMDHVTELLYENGADPTAVKTEAFSQALDDKERPALLRYITTYTMSTLAFVLIGGAIVRADVLKSNQTSTPQTPVSNTSQTISPTTNEQEGDAESGDDASTSTLTTPSTTQTTATTTPTTTTQTTTPVMRSYQRPVSTVS